MKFHHLYRCWVFYAVTTGNLPNCVCSDEKNKFTLFWLVLIFRWFSPFLQQLIFCTLEKFLFVWFVSISLCETMHQHLSFWANSAKNCIAEIFATWWNVKTSGSSCFTARCLQNLRKGKTKEMCLQLKVKAENPSRSKVTDLTRILPWHWTSSPLAENAKWS